jgi:K+-sensing histidine kinase KdpD
MSPRVFVSFLAGWIIGPTIVKVIRVIRESDVPIIVWCCIKEWYQGNSTTYHLPSPGVLKATAGTGICIVMADLVSHLGHTRYDNLYPLAFVAVVLICARYFGSIASLLGAISAAAVFAWVLYPPASFSVDDPIARTTISIMVLSGVAYSLRIVLRQHKLIQGSPRPTR